MRCCHERPARRWVSSPPFQATGMTSPSQSGHHDHDVIAEAAADWICRIQAEEINPDNCDELRDWLAADKRHTAAFRRMLDIFSATESLRRETPRQASVEISQSRPMPWRVAAAASTVLVLGLALSFLFSGEDFRTAIGERRLVQLEDGSSVHMNVDSDLTVRLRSASRSVELREGEVLFDVDGTDPRPFIVTTDALDVVVTGTSFQVTQHDAGVAVSVLEGSVDVSLRVTDGQDSGNPIALSAGEGLRLESGGIRRLSGLDPRRITGWRDGWLYLDNATVGELVERLNRQYDGDVRTDDTSLTDTRISVALRLQNRNKTFQRLEALLPVRIEELPGERFVVHSSP